MSDAQKNNGTVKWVAIIVTVLLFMVSIVFGTVQTSANYYLSRQNQFLVKSLDKVDDNATRLNSVESSYLVILEKLKALNEKVDRLAK